MPYRGTWEQTRKMRRVTAVHSTFWLKGTCARGQQVDGGEGERWRTLRSGEETSGRMGKNGRTRLRNRTVRVCQLQSTRKKRGTYIRSWLERAAGVSGRDEYVVKVFNSSQALDSRHVAQPVRWHAKQSTTSRPASRRASILPRLRGSSLVQSKCSLSTLRWNTGPSP